MSEGRIIAVVVIVPALTYVGWFIYMLAWRASPLWSNWLFNYLLAAVWLSLTAFAVITVLTR